ncbi:MAG: hypothetical protein WCD11_17260 [Solirubrobacteraceae bacterium]
MSQPCVIGPPRAFADIAERPREIPGSRHVMWLGNATPEQLVAADLVDGVIERGLEK